MSTAYAGLSPGRRGSDSLPEPVSRVEVDRPLQPLLAPDVAAGRVASTAIVRFARAIRVNIVRIPPAIH